MCLFFSGLPVSVNSVFSCSNASVLTFLSEPDWFLVAPFILGFWIPFETVSSTPSLLGRHLPSLSEKKESGRMSLKIKNKKWKWQSKPNSKKIRLCLKEKKNSTKGKRNKMVLAKYILFSIHFGAFRGPIGRGDVIFQCRDAAYPSSWAQTCLAISVALESITPACLI